MTSMPSVNQLVATSVQNRKLKITHKTEHQKSNKQQWEVHSGAGICILSWESVPSFKRLTPCKEKKGLGWFYLVICKQQNNVIHFMYQEEQLNT